MKLSPITTLRIDDDVLVDILSDKMVQRVVLQIGGAINGIRNTDLLLERLLQKIVEFIAAERAAVLLADLQPAAFRPSSFAVDATIAAQAQRERQAICVNAPSSVVCVPLRAVESDLGVIYLEGKSANAFSMRDLQLLVAAAHTAAAALDHTQYIGKLDVEKQQIREYTYLDHALVGESTPIRRVRDFIGKVAGHDSTVLILGESGTGKDVVANGIHHDSRRAKGPLVAINCGAIPESLVESELFGHEKGSFSGAVERKIGKIEIANGGTLFLDEIGELPLKTQVTLLRFLEDRKFERVGGTRPLSANVRIIAATNRNMEEWIKQGRFRLDLYYRLQVAQIRMPSLAEIRDDIPLLVEHFIQRMRYIRIVAGISDEAMAILTKYHWPGNARHLRNVIENALLLGTSRLIEADDLPDSLIETKLPQTESADYAASLRQYKKETIERALDESGGNQIEAASILNISTRQLRRLMRKFKVTLV